MKKSILTSAAAALIASCAIAGTGLANAAQAEAGNLPAVHSYQGVRYTSGGIGSDESTAMKAASGHWPLSLEFAIKSGAQAEYASNVHVLLKNSQGTTVLKATSQGPFLLAEVSPGNYQLDATLDGKSLQRDVVVRQGQSAHVVFEWPAGTDTRAPAK